MHFLFGKRKRAMISSSYLLCCGKRIRLVQHCVSESHCKIAYSLRIMHVAKIDKPDDHGEFNQNVVIVGVVINYAFSQSGQARECLVFKYLQKAIND